MTFPRFRLPAALKRMTLFSLFSLHLVAVAETREGDDRLRELERHFYFLQYQARPAVYCGSRLKRFARWVQRATSPMSDLPRLLPRIQRAWKFPLEPYIFQASGKLVTSAGIPLLHRFAMKNLWKHLREVTGSDRPLPKEDRKIFEALFGSGFTISDWRDSEDTLMEIRSAGVDGYLLWKRFQGFPGGGMILVARKKPEPRLIFSSLSGYLARERLSLLVPDRGRRFRWYGARVHEGMLDFVKATSREEAKERFSPTLLVRRGEAGEAKMYLGQAFPAPPFGRYRTMLLSLSVTLLFITVIPFWKGAQAGPGVAVSIRFKLVFLFLLSLIVCSAGTVFLGFHLLEDRRKVLGGELARTATEELNALDSRFLLARKGFSDLCRSIRGKVLSARNPLSTEGYLARLLREKRLIHFEIRDLMGNLILPRRHRASLEGLGNFFDAFAKIAIGKALGGRLANPPSPPPMPRRARSSKARSLASPRSCLPGMSPIRSTSRNHSSCGIGIPARKAAIPWPSSHSCNPSSACNRPSWRRSCRPDGNRPTPGSSCSSSQETPTFGIPVT